MDRKIRVLVIDDSATIRRLLVALLEQDAQIEVVGAAPDPYAARQMIKELNPDVLTLDVEMPGMSGLEFLDRLMRLRPMPVVMVSTLTERGADVTLDALALGAVDYFAKPTSNVFASLAEAGPELIQKVKTAARAKVRSRDIQPMSTPTHDADFADRLIAIGSSTGGVEALLEVLSHFPANCPPTVITQHMPAGFTKSFAARLDKMCAPVVREAAEAAEGAVLAPGHIFLAPGGAAHLEITGRAQWRCRLVADAATSGHRPSVDRLFHSVAMHAQARAVGVILTGMGRDGADGLGVMRAVGADTIGQDEATSVVYGMPRVAFETGAVARQLPLEKIGLEILRLCRQPHMQEA
jgi:two-component system chemotaxis response regulator CheB